MINTDKIMSGTRTKYSASPSLRHGTSSTYLTEDFQIFPGKLRFCLREVAYDIAEILYTFVFKRRSIQRLLYLLFCGIHVFKSASYRYNTVPYHHTVKDNNHIHFSGHPISKRTVFGTNLAELLLILVMSKYVPKGSMSNMWMLDFQRTE